MKRLPKEFSRTTKKPKLDITINKERSSAQSGVAVRTNLATTSNNDNAEYKPPSPNKTSLNNFWDDDDDDVILLATQVAEEQALIAAANNSNITECEITFSDFAPQIQSSTSTQQLPTTKDVKVPEINDLIEFFDDDDHEFAQLTVASVEKHAYEVKDLLFKKPIILPQGSSDTRENTQDVAMTSATAARRQLASDRQINFLMERVDALKKQNSKLTKELGEFKSKMESKEGETSLLRDELRIMKQQIQTLKMDKIFSTEATKTECKSQIAKLCKQVEAKEVELKLKSVKCSVLKMQQADDKTRFELSMRNETMCVESVHDKEAVQLHRHKIDKKSMRTLMCLRGLTLDDGHAKNSSSLDVSAAIYAPSNERGTTKKQRTIFQLELESIQTIVAQLEHKRYDVNTCTYSEAEIKTHAAKVLASVCKVFPEFWSYVHSLEFPKNCRIHPYHDYDLCKDVSERTRYSLYQPNELYEEERALSLRRYIAALAFVCQQLPPLSQTLLSYQHGEYALLQIVNDAICKLSFSREVCEHFGLIEAFAKLLHSLLVNIPSNLRVPGERFDLLLALLKQLIFTRPSAWVFREISACLLECTRLPDALSRLCVNSAANSFFKDRVRSLYRFTNDACLLQVYASLLEIAFPLSGTLRTKHFELLTIICLNHVRFMQNCFAQPTKFIYNSLPNDDSDIVSGESERSSATNASNTNVPYERISYNNSTSITNSTASSSAQHNSHSCNQLSCTCYTKLCLSIVTLLFQVLRYWLRSDKLLQTSHVVDISKASIQLLHNIFCDNYVAHLFRTTEETTRHFLRLICKWWSENSTQLQLLDIHLNFLEKLQNAQIMPKDLSDNSSDSSTNISSDLAEWQRITGDKSTAPSNDGCTHLQIDADQFFTGLQGYAFNFQ